MRKLFMLFGLLVLTGCKTDYLADITKDTHSGCFSGSTNYMGFTENITYIHLGEGSSAVNASPSCAGITQTSGLPSAEIIPSAPAPVGKSN